MNSWAERSTVTTDVIVIDNDRDRALGMIKAFEGTDCSEAIHLWKDGTGKTRCLNHKEIPKRCSILLWHVGDLAGDWGNSRPNLLVYYSGNGGEDVRFPDFTQERIWRPVKIGSPNTASGILTVDEAQSLLNYVLSCDTLDSVRDTRENLHGIAKPAFLEKERCYLSALAILCQGYFTAYSEYNESQKIATSTAAARSLQAIEWNDFLVSGKIETWFAQTDITQIKETFSLSDWWVKGLGFVIDSQEKKSKDIKAAFAACRTAVTNEWQQETTSNITFDAVLTLLDAIEKTNEASIDETSPLSMPITPNVVADAYAAITSQFPNLLSPPKIQYSLPEEDFTHILAIQSCSISMAASMVLSLFLKIDVVSLDGNSLQDSLKIYKKAVLVISEKHLRCLAQLRLKGFSGAVIALSPIPRKTACNVEKKKPPIMLWGHGSHCLCPFPCTLPFLISKALALFPMEPENLELLQNQLRAPISWLEERVIPLLDGLYLCVGDRSKHIQELSQIIQELRQVTPVVYHSSAKIDEQTMQIQHHFQAKLANLREARHNDQKAIADLRQVFETWRDLTVEGGESQGSFS